MELAQERAKVNDMTIELEQEKTSMESLKIHVTQIETALKTEQNCHNSTKR